MYQEIKVKLKGSLFRWFLGRLVSWLVGWSQRWADPSLFRSPEMSKASNLFLGRRNIFDISEKYLAVASFKKKCFNT